MTKGAQLIAKERDRQLTKLKWDSKHDDECHHRGELAMAACCYAATEKIYVKRHGRGDIYLVDPWPFGYYYRGEWSDRGWKPKSKSRVDDLTKAGALIAAEIDRLLREEKRDKRKTD